MKITTDDYSVSYDPATDTIVFQGILRLLGTEAYAPIFSLLQEVVSDLPKALILDLRELNLLNSSGIGMLSKFTIGLRQHPQVQLILKGSKVVPWQEQSLKNLKRLLPSMQIEME